MFRLIHIALILFGTSLISACNISGTVSRDGVGLADVKITLSGDPEKTVTTDSDGHYSFYSVDPGTYIITLEPPAGFTRVLTRTLEKSSSSLSNIDFSLNSDSLRETETGKVIGFEEDNGTHAWLGIPFAEPPIESRRWKAPLPASSWSDDSYLALQHGSSCIQATNELHALSDGDAVVGEPLGSEDCLYLNIRAPQFSPQDIPMGNERLPVMVWIHGGANIGGSSSEYNGKALAQQQNVIVVTINYRLSLFGWFSHPALQTGDSLDDSGNYGTLDNIRALQWIQDNIEQFGGDPNNVTVFGESAGAWNVLTLMLSPLADGLFHKAISQSGRINTYELSMVQNYIEDGGYYHSGREIFNNLLIAEGEAGDRLAAKLLQNEMALPDIRERLYSKSAAQIIAAGNNEIPFQKILTDGVMPRWFLTKFRDGTVLPKENPLTQFQNADSYNAVPLIIGSNRDEHKLYMMFEPEFVHTLADLPMLPKNKNYYDLYAEYKSEMWKIFGVDMIVNALRSNPQQPEIFAYRFDWDEQPKILFVDLGFLMGAAHGMEIPFVFNYFDAFRSPTLDALLFTKKNAPGREQLGASMSSYWAEFAYHGSPGFGRLNSESHYWQPWNSDPVQDNLMVFHTQETDGIRMANQRNSVVILKEKLQADTRFSNHEQRCSVYIALFSGTELWQQAEYQGLAEVGCPPIAELR
ncbi:MAG: carboxylesterase family protein [Pseudomonadales bacterium]|nr:carboxylesterase family protein [Pseudomonadales bacterium]